MKLRSLMPELKGATAWVNGKMKRENLIGEKLTLIHFWSVSCHECKEIMPQVSQLRDKYKNDINFIAVHMPRSKEDTDIEIIKNVALKFKITQPIYIDNQMSLTDAFNNQYVPAYYVFDKKGVLRHFQAGGSGMKLLEKRVNSLINES
jgi:thiol-disulfide isomerase/thioredoxin